MKKVNEPGFWKERIDWAVKDFFTVYVTTDEDWNYIRKVHKELMDTHIPKESKVLDAGCGYGRWSENFDNYTGIDISPDFIDMAKSKYPDKTFLVADLSKLPFKKQEFDWAFCVSIKAMVIGNLGEAVWEKYLRQLKKVAKNVLILEYSKPWEYEIL